MTAKRQAKRLAVLLAGAYVLLALLAAFGCDRLMFHPHPSGYVDSPDIIKLKTADGAAISARYLPHRDAQYTLLHSHGNGEDMADLDYVYQQLNNAGFGVLAYDYHGYGTSGGKPSESAAYADIDAAYEYLTQQLKIPPERIILIGRSIGGGPSVDLASRKPVGGLVLESTFISAFRVVTRVPLLPWDKFENLKKLPRVRCPVLVVHGQEDRLVPAWHGRRLYEAAPGASQCLWVEQAGHNDLFLKAPDQYCDALRLFATELVKDN